MNAWDAARRAVALAAAGLVVTAGPAAADAAGPGDFSSEVTSVEPEVDGFSIETSGGDSFLTVTADDGVEVELPGYQGEPYLRFNVSGDGIVEQNTNSPAVYINDDRFGSGELAPAELQDLDAEALQALEPEWEEVSTDGTWSWHDHRTHEMRPDAPVDRGESYDWLGPVELTVDGQAVAVNGRITFHDDVSPLPWFALAVIAAGVFGVLGVRLADRVPPGLVAGAAAAATIVAYLGYASLPSGTGASIVPTVVGAVALVLGIVGLLVGRLRPIGLLAGGVFLATWGVFRLSVLSNPVLPTDVPFVLERVMTALALGLGIGAVILAFRSGALTLALLPLDDDEADDG